MVQTLDMDIMTITIHQLRHYKLMPQFFLEGRYNKTRKPSFDRRPNGLITIASVFPVGFLCEQSAESTAFTSVLVFESLQANSTRTPYGLTTENVSESLRQRLREP